MGTFLGINQQEIVPDGEFSDMGNLSARNYPAISTREPRGEDVRTFDTPNGLYWKNHLFYIDGNTCYYNGEAVSGLSVTSGEKQIVGMGAYIIILPDKKIFNTATGEVSAMDASLAPQGTIMFQELSRDSVYTKITVSGIGNTFRAKDGVQIDGVLDPSFTVDGEGMTKVITEAGADYIVVTASIQKTYTGAVTITGGSSVQVSGDGLHDAFDANDYVQVIGCEDDALNVSGKATPSGDGISINASFPERLVTTSGTVSISPYYSGSGKAKIQSQSLGTVFHKGDYVGVTGCTNPYLNRTSLVHGAGENYILIDGDISEAFTQTAAITVRRYRAEYDSVVIRRTGFRRWGVTFRRKSPDMDFVCEHGNRLWGCSSLNHEIYASKLGDPTNWNCFEGISTDSYAATVGTDGDFTGCISHMGYALFFKEDSIHTVYGNKPSNFQLDQKQMPGVREGCAGSLTVVDETLYYVGRNGVYSFDGAFPAKISEKIVSDISDAVASRQDGRLYLSCLLGGKQALLTYDPRYRTWHREDGTRFRMACYGEGKAWYIGEDKVLRSVTGDSGEDIRWYMESGDIVGSPLSEKYISKAKFVLVLEAGAVADVFFRYDGEPLWKRAGTVHSTRKTVYTLPIVARRCMRFRWRMEGKGQMKLLAMAVTVEGGTEINGIVQPVFRG